MMQIAPKEAVSNLYQWIKVGTGIDLEFLRPKHADVVAHDIFISIMVGSLVWLFWPILVRVYKKFWINGSDLDGTISFESDYIPLPTIVPVTGTINTIQLNASDCFAPISHGKRMGRTGDKWEWEPSLISDHGYRCKIKNYGKEAVTDVQLELDFYFLETVKIDSGTRSGGVKRHEKGKISIPILNAGATEEYELYIYNAGGGYVQSPLPEKAILKKIGDKKSHTVKINSSHGFPKSFPMTFSPPTPINNNNEGN